MLMIDYTYRFFEIFFISYFLIYNTINLLFVFLSLCEVRRKVIGRGFDDLDVIMNSPFTPPISIIVPCYNEAKTIVSTINSLSKVKFPRSELIVVNDGSADETLEIVKKAFQLERIDIDYLNRITTAPIKGCYETKVLPADNIFRFVLVDKENGGKADALNAGINASRCPYFLSMDADSIIDEAALLQAFRAILDHKEIGVIGGRVAIVNGCEVKDGNVISSGLPKSWLARFQMAEYMRSFTVGRTALARLQSLLILSGVFSIFEKELVQKIGGYLTKHLTSKIALEYTGSKAETVCEDMEIIVRMQRYIQEKKIPKRISYLPHPLCWTEVPENLKDLAKQRNRWQRGFIETFTYHRKMLFNKKYNVMGLFALPYFFLFEFLGAPIEFFGYITLPVLFFLDDMNYLYVFMFFIVSVLLGSLNSVFSIFVSAWPEKTTETKTNIKSLVYFNSIKEIIILSVFGIMENFGYRQMNVWWRIKGWLDFFKGKKEWDKFDRIGFERKPAKPQEDTIEVA